MRAGAAQRQGKGQHFMRSMPSCRSPTTSTSCGLGLFGVALICARTSFSCCSYLRASDAGRAEKALQCGARLQLQLQLLQRRISQRSNFGHPTKRSAFLFGKGLLFWGKGSCMQPRRQ